MVMASIDEVADGIYRVNIEVPQSPVTYSFFVIDDEQPTLVQTGFGRMFDESLEAVKRVIDPARLRYIVVPHFEGDECGALNHFLELAPNAVVLGSPIGARGSLLDFAIRPPQAVNDGNLLDLGGKRLRILITPWVHQWDSLLTFEE